MKKILLILAAVLCVATVSAQSKGGSNLTAHKWSVGLRVGSDLQVDVEHFYSNKAYIEGRLGLCLLDDNFVDFNFLHNWNCCDWNWTPSAGRWFLDAGVGARVGGNGDLCVLGVTGQVKFGIKFNSVPFRLALDVTPSFGPVIRYNAKNDFYSSGIFTFGLSATYCF